MDSNVLYFFSRDKKETNLKELLDHKWVTYDNKNFFINRENIRYEIKLNKEALSEQDFHSINQKIEHKSDSVNDYLIIFYYKNQLLERESYYYKKINTNDRFKLHNEKGYPACIIYDNNESIKEVYWVYEGNDVTERVVDLIKTFNINSVKDLFKKEIKELVEINISN